MIPLLLFIPLLIAGPNYDLEQLDERNFSWSSHYERIYDGSNWVNYVWIDNGNTIRFDSANLSYELNKNDCSFSLLEPMSNRIAIEKYDKALLIDDIPAALPSCTITNIDPSAHGLKITATQNGGGFDFKTIWESNGAGFIEWTYEMVNGDFLTSKRFKIIEDCINCTSKGTNGDLIDVGSYVLDTKNRIHNSLKATDTKSGVKLTFETEPSGFLEKVIIDPLFSSNNPDEDGHIISTNTVAVSCSNSAGSKDVGATVLNLYLGPSGASDGCYRSFAEYNITSIPDTATITSAFFLYDVQALFTTGQNCDFVGMTVQPTVGTDEAIYDDIAGPTATILSKNSADCATVSDNVSTNFDLTNATSYFDGQLSLDWAAIGIKITNEVRGAGTLGSQIASETHALPTPPPTLTLTYEVEPILTTFQTLEIENIGDILDISGIIGVNNSTWANITSIVLIVNGTIENTNSTTQNKTAQHQHDQVNYGPLWYQMLTDNIYNITIQATAQNTTTTQSNITTTLISRGYDPIYSNSIVTSQGGVNYTFDDTRGLLVNRNQSGATWQIECNWLELSDAFLGNPSTVWTNETVIAAFSGSIPTTAAYVSCYNDDLLFTTSLPTNYTSQLQGGLVIFDELGGFMGAPAVMLVVLGLISMATGRNFPIIAVITISTIGVLGALGLLIMDGALWGFLIVAAGITIFGIRKFF